MIITLKSGRQYEVDEVIFNSLSVSVIETKTKELKMILIADIHSIT